ncbi:hypothetical protein LEP1GSC195_3901 [Leptospira wolbachii serovar Codice str. CDC]|uniref:Uncharacterized protein n=1 Tax=Leptospira wolbachii serovar Codice str. CDC TaxID=1218599 RepID=R9A1Q3_9LEPT|nr:hypothetical protein LEP1GSC195_3901 [Leptospira wolbachii serovar Codice str. CDC]
MIAKPYNAEREGMEDFPTNRYAIARETKERIKSERKVEKTMATN